MYPTVILLSNVSPVLPSYNVNLPSSGYPASLRASLMSLSFAPSNTDVATCHPRALAASPDFMLLDEPFAGIDPIAIGEIKDNIKKISEDKGLGVLITDHNPKATLSITDRAYVIFDGQIKIQGRSVDVANDPDARKYYLGKDFAL